MTDRPLSDLAASAEARELLAEQIARLELLRRLSLGAAHTLNNAFTAILGETLCLADERKPDRVVTEACEVIQGEIERCARLTRSVTSRIQRRESALEETNVVALVRTLEPLLRETVSRSIALEVQLPDRCILVRGPAEDLEILLLLAAHRLARVAGSGSTLRIELGSDGPSRAELVFALRAPDAESIAADASATAWDAVVADATAVLGARHGVAVTSDATRIGFQFELAG
jgi:signal transduction histidine kinase